MLEPSPTIYGIETEYSCLVVKDFENDLQMVGKCHAESNDDQVVEANGLLYKEPKQDPINWVTIAQRLKPVLKDQGIEIDRNGMLSNGGRFYFDPSGPEYSTAEHTTARGAVVESQRADMFVFKAFLRLQEMDAIKSFQLNRRNTNHNRTSRGVHINLTTNIDKPLNRDNIYKIASIEALKGAMFGSGGLLLNEHNQTEFHHAPRLSLTDRISDKQYYYRGLFRSNFKDDNSQLSRIEYVSGDSLNFAWPMRASMVVSNAVLGLIEIRRHNRLPKLSTPVLDARVIGQHGPSANVILNGNNKSAMAIDLLSQACQVCLDVDDQEGYLSGKESRFVLNDVVDTADLIKSDYFAAGDKIESIARELSFEHYINKKKLTDYESASVCRYDYYWDIIGASGLAEKLKRYKGFGWQGFGKFDKRAYDSRTIARPPQDTRAKLRSQAILNSEPVDNWHSFSLGGKVVHPHILDTKISDLSDID